MVVAQTGIQVEVVQVERPSPLSDVHGSSIKGDMPVVSLVIGLLSITRPSAVIRRIWAVVVDALNGKAVWAWPHISQEVFKRLLPAVTNRNTASSVSGIGRRFWVSATFDHAAPTLIFTADFSVSSVTVCQNSGMFFLPASARLGKSKTQLRDVYEFGRSALTSAKNKACCAKQEWLGKNSPVVNGLADSYVMFGGTSHSTDYTSVVSVVAS